MKLGQIWQNKDDDCLYVVVKGNKLAYALVDFFGAYWTQAATLENLERAADEDGFKPFTGIIEVRNGRVICE
jgi:hypothetical protein